jgi:hypothetical protein
MSLKQQLFFVGILFFSLSHLNAQIRVVEEKRLEHEGSVITSITPDNKIITYSIQSDKGSDDRIEIVSFDEHFKEKGRYTTSCPEKIVYRTSALSGTGDYYFSLVIDKNRKIHSLVFNTENNEGAKLQIDLVDKFIPNGNLDFLGGYSTVCFQNKFFVLGTVKRVPCILVYNMLTGTQHITFIPGMNKKMRVSFLSSDESAPSLQLMYFNYKSNKVENQTIVSINEFGELAGKPCVISAVKDKMLIDGNVTWIDENTYLMCGSSGRNSAVASGMYIIEMKDGQVLKRNDYSFNDFKDFYSTFNAKTQKRVERKKKRNKNFESQCYMVTHPVVFNENTWTVVGEVFYPTYRTEYRTVYVNGKPTFQTVYVFDGFAYSHAVVLQVSPELEKIRDYAFNLDIFDKPHYPKKFVRIQQADSKLNFYYASSNRFGHAFLENGGITESETLIIVEEEGDLKDSEKLKDWSSVGVSYWYENYYLVTESIEIKDKEATAGNKRKQYIQFKKIKIEE